MAPHRASTATHPANLPFPVVPSSSRFPSSTVATMAASSANASNASHPNDGVAAVVSPKGEGSNESGSWSTLSMPKSLLSAIAPPPNTSASSTSPTVPVPAPPPQPLRTLTQESLDTSSINAQKASTVATGGPSSVPGPSSDSIPSSFRKAKKPSARKRPKSSPPPAPPAPRQLIPEPAPPPPDSSLRLPSKDAIRIANHSRDRLPQKYHTALAERRLSTPYPNPLIPAAARRQRMYSAPVPAPRTQVEAAIAELAMKGSMIMPQRRPSPVPPSSSRSDSARSSDSYDSLNDQPNVPLAGKAEVADAVASNQPLSPIQEDVPRNPNRRSSISHFLASLRNPPRSPLRYNTLPQLSPVPGVPRIFHPSPLNPHPPATSPLNPTFTNAPSYLRSPEKIRSPLLNRAPGRNAHVIPLPSLAYTSIQQRPRPLPPSEIGERVWTPTQTGAEEYASDNPVDLVHRAWEMEARDELERVKRWTEDVWIWSWAIGPMDEAEEELAEMQLMGDETGFWENEKAVPVDVEKHTPRYADDAAPSKDSPSTASAMANIPVNDISPMNEDLKDATNPLNPNPVTPVEVPTPQADVVIGVQAASPYPAPVPPEVHLDSSSSAYSDQMDLPIQSAHLGIPQVKNPFLSMGSPSPIGLPSPLRLPIMQTPKTPFWNLKSGEAVMTPPAQEPLPPIPSEPAATPAAPPVDLRIASVLDQVSSYLSNAASPRPPSPETPPRIPHSSTERDQPREDGPKLGPSKLRPRSPSVTESPNSPRYGQNRYAVLRPRTESCSSVGMSRSTRGRSPTRRSWKAASERASTRPVAVRPQEDAERAAVSIAESWHLSSVGDGLDVERPRTASRSTRTSSPPAPRPETRASVMTTELFYGAQPQASPSVQNLSQSSVPETVKPEDVTRGQVRLPAAPANETYLGPVQRLQEDVSPSVLRRRKSHRAPRSVMSFPMNEDQVEMSNPLDEDDLKDKAPTKPTPVNRSPSKSRIPLPRSVEPKPKPMSQPPSAPKLEGLRPITTSQQPRLPLGASSTASNPTLPFLKFITLLTQFTSDLSNDRRGIPRWKHDFSEIEEKVQDVFEAFRNAVARSKVEFRPWIRDNERPSREDDDEQDERKLIMYIDDVSEKLEALGGSRGRLPIQVVQEDIIDSIFPTWDVAASNCLNGIRGVLEQLVTCIVETHFRCAGDGNELREIVQSISESQMDAAWQIAAGKLAELAMLESKSLHSATNSRLQANAAVVLAHYRDIRRRTEGSVLGASNSPAQVPMSDDSAGSIPPYVFVNPQSHSHSRDSNGMSASIPSTNTAPSASIFSKNGPLSTAATTSEEVRDPKAGLRRRIVQRHQRSDSLRSNEAVQVLLSNLRTLGINDTSAAEKLYDKLIEQDSADEALEVMAYVEAYLDAASSRFIDYATLNIEQHLVDIIGEKINTAVLSTLDLASEATKQRCHRWMTATA